MFACCFAVHVSCTCHNLMCRHVNEQPINNVQSWNGMTRLQQHGTWSAFITTNRARSASCCATCLASTALVNCSHQEIGENTLPVHDVLPETSIADASCHGCQAAAGHMTCDTGNSTQQIFWLTDAMQSCQCSGSCIKLQCNRPLCRRIGV